MSHQKNFPSLLRVMDVFGTKEKSLLALKILRAQTQQEVCALSDHAAQYVCACFYCPDLYDVKLHALDELGETYGIECARRRYGYTEPPIGEYAEYLNSGDTYAPTVIYWRGKFRIQSIGDFLEKMEGNHCIRFN